MSETIVIQSNAEGLADVERFLAAFCDDNHIANYFATISVPVLQAVENAIVHGNLNNPSKKVIIEYGYRLGGIYFLVSDEGNGFDYTQYGNCPLNNEKGQGVFLMKSLADHIEFFNGGKSIRMDFDINGIEAIDALERIDTLQHFFMPNIVAV